ncbi:hypothetical protein NM208_g7185 [Fusarium decemcellulare]|uniref:Uncharacterized protein n=1 Tax=Fusarium decemcellulare TaxID=57161 RepID=A0ACC1SA55_9HYPO|nr:hypothetical protein NM208_g7185 [Fusarium decemcellulare]
MPPPVTKYAVALFPGFQALDVFGPIDALNVLSKKQPLSLYMLHTSLDPVPTLIGSETGRIGQSVVPTHTYDTAPEDIEVLLVPGGMGTRDEPSIVRVREFVKERYPKLRYLLTVCTGSSIVAQAGILDGKRATSNKRLFSWVKSQGPNVNWVLEARWVVDGNIWTASGISAGIDMAFAFITEQYGKEAADDTAIASEYVRNTDPTVDPFAHLSQGLNHLLQAIVKHGRVFIGALVTAVNNMTGLRPIIGTLGVFGTLYGINRILNNKLFNSRTRTHLWNWDKEIVLITGGSGGMGSHMVNKFAQRNVTVISLDIHPPKHALPTNARFYEVDITSPEEIKEAAEQIRREVGDPTVLINNAGIALGKDILSCTQAPIRHMFNVNILSHFWLVQEFLPAMIKQDHGQVVTMASIASYVTIASNIDYSCTKAGLLAFHEGLVQDLKHRYNTRNIIVSIIHPYWVRTPLIQNLTAHPTFRDPLEEPEHVAAEVVDHVMGCRGGQLFIPGYGALFGGIRAFPMWLQEGIRDRTARVLRDTTF